MTRIYAFSVQLLNFVYIYYKVYERGWGSPSDKATASQEREEEGADGDTEEENGKGVGEVRLNSQIVVHPKVDGHGANQQEESVDLIVSKNVKKSEGKNVAHEKLLFLIRSDSVITFV